MSVHLDTLRYITESVSSIYQFEDNDVVKLTQWFIHLENLARVFKIEDYILDYTFPLLRYEYAAWSLYQEFDSWESFKYDLLNKMFPFRLDLGQQVKKQVDLIKIQIEEQDPQVFKTCDKFVALMNELYKVVAPFEDWVREELEVLGNFDALDSLLKPFRSSRIEVNRLYFKQINDLSSEEEEKLMNDDGHIVFWNEFRILISQFLNRALQFGLSVDKQTRSPDVINISKLSVKLMNNI